MTGLGIFIAGFGAFALARAIVRPRGFVSPGDEPWVVLVFCGVLALGLLIVGRMFYGLELREDRFSVRFVGRREYACNRFVGYRRTTSQGKNSRSYRYVLVGGPGQRDVIIRLDSAFFAAADRKAFEKWASRFPDLESADIERETADRALSVAAGSSISRRRAAKIARAFRWAATAACVGTLGMLFLGAEAGALVRLTAIAVCLLLPAAAAVKVWRPDAFQLGRASGTRLPASLNDALWLGAITPAIPAMTAYAPLRWSAPIAAALIAAAVVGYPLFRFGLNRVDRTPGGLASAAALLLLYAWSAAVTLNGALDWQVPNAVGGLVRDRHTPHGRGSAYSLDVELRIPEPYLRKIRVPRGVFDRTKAGDTVHVIVGAGGFRIPWVMGVVPYDATAPYQATP